MNGWMDGSNSKDCGDWCCLTRNPKKSSIYSVPRLLEIEILLIIVETIKADFVEPTLRLSALVVLVFTLIKSANFDI